MLHMFVGSCVPAMPGTAEQDADSAQLAGPRSPIDPAANQPAQVSQLKTTDAEGYFEYMLRDYLE